MECGESGNFRFIQWTLGQQNIYASVYLTICGYIFSWSLIRGLHLPKVLVLLHFHSYWVVPSCYLLFQEPDSVVVSVSLILLCIKL